MDHAHTLPAQTSLSRWGALASIWRFTRHLGEMLIAMFLGMIVLSLAEMALGTPPGDNTLLGGYAYMGLAMTLPMVAWMRWMGHPWKDCAEMSAAMLGPMFAVVLPAALGWVNTGLEDKPMIAFEILNLKARILAKQGDKAGAIAAAKQSTELAIKAEGPNNSFVWMNQQLISSLQ